MKTATKVIMQLLLTLSIVGGVSHLKTGVNETLAMITILMSFFLLLVISLGDTR